MRNSTTKSLLLGTFLSAIVLPLGAAQFDFYKLGNGASDFLPTNGIVVYNDIVSSNVDAGIFSGNLTFVKDGITATATATYNGNVAAVVQDRETNWTSSKGAGLGVYHLSKNTSDDNITLGESLTITFDRVVNLSSIGLRSDGHNYTSWVAGDEFLLNGIATLLPDNVGSLAVNMTGTSFTFAFKGNEPLSAQFYLSSLTVSAVPDGGASIALFSAALLALGLMRRRR
jgi:hypothetical protein